MRSKAPATVAAAALCLAPPDIARTEEPVDAPITITLSDGLDAIEQLLESPLWSRVRTWPEWREFLQGKDIRKGRTALRFFAGALGVGELELVKELLGRDVELKLLPESTGKPARFLLALRASSADTARRVEELLFQAITLAGDSPESLSPGGVRSADGELFQAVEGDLVVVSNDPQWIESERSRPASPVDDRTPGLHASLDLDRLRRLGALPPIPERYDNALVPLLLHGILKAFSAADRAQVDVRWCSGEIEAELSLPLDRRIETDNAWFFPDPVPFPDPPDWATMWTFLRRDFDGFFQRRFDLMDEDLEGNIREFDSVTSLFLGGRSFGEELLPALGDAAILVLSEPRFEDTPEPSAVFPAFSLAAPLETGAVAVEELLIAFQTVIGIVNADRAQDGLAPLFMSTREAGDVRIASARFLADPDAGDGDVRYNVHPALGVGHGYVVVGSSRPAVEDLLDHLASGAPARALPASEMRIDVQSAIRLLVRNEDHLVARRMLEESQTRAEAEAFWSRLLAALETFDSAGIRLSTAGDAIRIGLDVRMRELSR